MSRIRFEQHEWALILGGSSGFGLATAKRLARHGMNVFIVHRDRRGAMKQIEPEFDSIRHEDVRVETMNVNALTADGMGDVLSAMGEALGDTGRVSLLLHSIAFGNLKLLAPIPKDEEPPPFGLSALAERLGVELPALQDAVRDLFEGDHAELHTLMDPGPYSDKEFLGDEDFALTVHSMGTSLATWVRAVFERGLFASRAQVLGLTSEGNAISWRAYAAVSAAKAALESISRSIAVEYAPHGIRSNIIQAGVTDTKALGLIPGSAHLRARATLRNPNRRLTRPEDVADVIMLLCLPEANWINGNIIRADGGESISGL